MCTISAYNIIVTERDMMSEIIFLKMFDIQLI